MNLREELNGLASRFASDVLSAIRSASLKDILSSDARSSTTTRSPRSPARAARADGRMPRRSVNDIERTLGTVVVALKAGPMRSEQIQKTLRLDKRELPRVLRHGVKTRQLKFKGQKRSRTYSAA